MKFFHFSKYLVLCLAALSITACSTVTGGRKIDYKAAAVTDKLEVPPDLTSLPDSERGGVTTFSGYAAGREIQPTGEADVLPKFAKVKLVRQGGERWLVVSEKPATLWPQLREFLLGLGLSIARENRATGIIETDWAENRASKGGRLKTPFGFFRDTGVRDRYRIRIEEARDNSGGTEVHLSHQGLVEEVASGGGDELIQTVWQRSGPDKELEAEMLRLLMVHLGVEDAKARSMLTAGVAQPRASLEFDENDVANLRTIDPFASAWRRVGKALDRLGAEIESKDRNKGIYTIAVAAQGEKASKPGFLGRLLGKEKAATTPYRVRITALKKGTGVQLLEREKDRPVATPAGRVFMKQLYEALR
jgi:outer membrane protein assembly factor BamC